MAKTTKTDDRTLEQRIEERRKVVEARQKKFGIPKSTLIIGGEHEKYEFIPLGIPEIDLKLKTTTLTGEVVHGLLRGTIVEFCGPSMSGKTYGAYHAAKEHQARGLRVLFIDVERGYYEPRAVQLGVNIEDPDLWELQKVTFSAEKVGDYLIDCVNSGDYGLIIVDSIATLIPEADFDKSLEDNAKIGAHAQFMGRLLRKLAASRMEDNLTTVILINQLRAGAGAMPNTFTDKSTGGKGVEYWTRIRLWFARQTAKAAWKFDAQGNRIGGTSRCTIYKTKTGGQDEIAEFPVFFVPADRDEVGDFMHRCLVNKDFENILTYQAPRGSKVKMYRYVDPETGELIASENKYDFCSQVMHCAPPEKRVRTDKSNSMFEYMLARTKYDVTKIDALIELIRNPPAETAPLEIDNDNSDNTE